MLQLFILLAEVSQGGSDCQLRKMRSTFAFIFIIVRVSFFKIAIANNGKILE